MHRIAIVMLGIAAAGLVACQKPAPTTETSAPGRDEPAAAASADLPDTSAPNESGAAEASQGITMRYTCDQGHSVAIMRGDTARVTLAEGRVVEIRRVADSSPPRYRGEALSFEVGSDGATLGQDEGGDFPCREAD